jgi:arylsulfatase A-like enzyme
MTDEPATPTYDAAEPDEHTPEEEADAPAVNVNRRDVLRASGAAGTLASAIGVGTVGTVAGDEDGTATAARIDGPIDQPNVLFVMLDQLRAAGVRRYRENNDVVTPTMNHLANTGVYFENHVSPDPVCSPARASILTGRYPHATDVIANGFPLPPTERTLPQALNEHGYRTGYVGRWHLGPTPYQLPDDKHSAYVPPEYRGAEWDKWLGFNEGGKGDTHDGMLHFSHDGTEAWWERENEFQPTIQTDKVLNWIEEWENEDVPWYAHISYDPPHWPLDVPNEYKGAYDPDELQLRPNVPEAAAEQAREWLAKYYALTTATDAELRRLHDKIHELGIAGDTIIVVTADHGSMLRSHGLWGKWLWYEESVRTPLIMRYPGAIAERQPVPGMASTVDVAPTLAGWTGAQLGQEVGAPPVHGHDLSTYLTRKEYGGDGSVGLIGDEVEYMEGLLGRDREWRGVRRRNDMIALNRHGETIAVYNLEDDPYQLDNLAGEYRNERNLRQAVFRKARELDDRRFLVGAANEADY